MTERVLLSLGPQDALNSFMELGPAAWAEARATVTRLLSASEAVLRDSAELRRKLLVPQVWPWSTRAESWYSCQG